MAYYIGIDACKSDYLAAIIDKSDPNDVRIDVETGENIDVLWNKSIKEKLNAYKNKHQKDPKIRALIDICQRRNSFDPPEPE